MLSDLRQAFRQLAKSPGFTLTALLTLALGIGACTAIFSVVNSVLLRPAAYPDSEHLVVLKESWPPQYPTFSIAPANYLDWAAQTTDVFEGLYACHRESFSLTGTGMPPAHVQGLRATGRYFEILRATPLLGRVFGPADDVPAHSRVVVLSHGLWQKHFGGRRDVIGETIRINGWPLTVIGVMPAGFQRDGHHEFFVPIAFPRGAHQDRGSHYLAAGARLKPGVTLEQARARLALVAADLARRYPETNHGWTVTVTPLLEHETAGSRATLYTLLAAVAALLLIACANLANLLLARATARHRELSVRAALGASRTRLVRALLAESILLALAGGALGLLVGSWSLDAILALAPADLPRAAEISLDGRALTATFLLTLFTALAFGLAPALHASRIDLVSALHDGSRTNSDGRQRRFLRHTFVVIELALALTLLAGAGLLMRSFTKLLAFDPGFTAPGAVMAQVTVPFRTYNTPEKQNAFADRVLERYRALPGVTHVAVTNVMPMADGGQVVAVERPLHSLRPLELPIANAYSVSSDYVAAAGIRLLRGRSFVDSDHSDAAPVALISQSAAASLFPGLDPIGQRLRPGGIAHSRPWREVVGVVADVQHHGPIVETASQVYFPFAQSPAREMTFVIRTSRDPTALLPALRREFLALDPEQPIARLEPLTHLLSTSIARQRFALIVFGIFAAAALLLAALGIYGVMAYSVSRRTSEFGIRLALGAQRTDIARLVLSHALRLTVIGLAAGAIVAFLVTRFVESLLYKTPAHDPLTFATVTAVLFTVALLAAWLPARRATRVDPMTALRAE